MRGVMLLLFYFSSSIFFCTLSLFSSSYESGGTTYSLYIFSLAAIIGFILLLNSIKVFVRHEFILPPIKVVIIFVFLVLLVFVAAGYAYSRTEATLKMLQFFLAFTTPSIFLALSIKEKDIHIFYKFMKYLNVYLTISVFLAFIKTGNLDSLAGASHLTVGYTMAAMFPFNFIMMTNEKSLFKKLFYMILLVFNIYATFLSGSRGALAGIVVTFIIMFYMYGIKERKFFSNLLLLAFVVFGVVYVLNNTNDTGQGLWRMSLLLSEDGGISSSGRDIYYETAISQFNDHPIIGNGVAAFKNRFGFYVFPHNIFLEVLTDFGIVGLTLFVIALLITTKKARIMLKRDIQNQYIVLLFVQSMVMLMVSGSFLVDTQFWISLTLILTVGCRVVISQAKKMHHASQFSSSLELSKLTATKLR